MTKMHNKTIRILTRTLHYTLKPYIRCGSFYSTNEPCIGISFYVVSKKEMICHKCKTQTTTLEYYTTRHKQFTIKERYVIRI